MTKAALMVGILALCAGCTKDVPKESESESGKPAPSEAPSAPKPADAAMGIDVAKFQRFVIKDFNWEIQGYDLLEINADGKAMLLEAAGYREKHRGEEVTVAKWHRVDWTLSASELDEFRSELVASNFAELDKLYINRDVDDGQNVEFILVAASAEHRVTCSNKFPPPIRALRKWASKATAPHRKDLKKQSKPIERKDAEVIWKRY